MVRKSRVEVGSGGFEAGGRGRENGHIDAVNEIDIGDRLASRVEIPGQRPGTVGAEVMRMVVVLEAGGIEIPVVDRAGIDGSRGGSVQGVSRGGDALVRREKGKRELLGGTRPFGAKPDPQVDLAVVGEDGWWNGRHIADVGIAQANGEETFADGDDERIGRLAIIGAVITPVDGIPDAIDEGELESPVTVEVDPVHSHASLVVDDTRNVR